MTKVRTPSTASVTPPNKSFDRSGIGYWAARYKTHAKKIEPTPTRMAVRCQSVMPTSLWPALLGRVRCVHDSAKALHVHVFIGSAGYSTDKPKGESAFFFRAPIPVLSLFLLVGFF